MAIRRGYPRGPAGASKRAVSLAAATTAFLCSVIVGCDGSVLPPTEPRPPGSGSGVVVQEARPVVGITGVNLSTVGRVEITQGNQETLIVEADDNLMQFLETVVGGGILRLRNASQVQLRPTRPIRFILTVVALESATLAGVGDIEVSGLLDVERLDLVHAGVGDIVVPELRAEELRALLAGVGGISVSGEVTRQEINSNGVGQCDNRNLSSTEATVRITGIGNVTVRVSERLLGQTSFGTIFYIGDPEVFVSVTPPGRVVKIEE